MRIRVALIFAILACFAPKPALTHQDRIFNVSDDGTIEGLPDEYQPARVVVAPSADGVAVELTLSGKALTLPSCLGNLFLLPPSENMSLSGSWYHSRSTLPPYLNVLLPQKSKEGDSFLYTGSSLLFNLETAELIEVRSWELVGTGAQGKDVPLDSICSPKERETLKPRPAA